MKKRMELTAIIQKGENGFYIGQIEQYPAALSQGKTIEELKENLIDALKLLLEVQLDQLKKQYSKKKIIKRSLVFTL